MTTDYAAWLVKMEVQIVAKKCKCRTCKISIHECDKKTIVRIENASPKLASSIVVRYHDVKWGDGKLRMTVKHIPVQKLVYVNINEI